MPDRDKALTEQIEEFWAVLAFDAIASEIMWWVYEERNGEDVEEPPIDEDDDLASSAM